MKRLVVLFVASVLVLWACGQSVSEKNVPPKVREAFSQAYPDVKKAKWSMEKTNYEAEFKTSDGTNISVLIDPTGQIVETEKSIHPSQLPEPVMQYVKENYKNSKIREAATITDKSGKVEYEVEIDGKDLIFNSKGEFLRIAR